MGLDYQHAVFRTQVASTNAVKPVNGSKDVNFRLVHFWKNKQSNCHLLFLRRPWLRHIKISKPSPVVTPHQQKFKPKSADFKKSNLWDVLLH